jgi:hypothetical protein
MNVRAALCAAVVVAAIAGQWMFWRGGILEFEATAFIPQYVADRAPLAKLFDPHSNDFDAYQARELSYVFDYADAVFHASIARRFHASLFIPLSSMLATLGIGILVMRGVRETMVRIDAVTTALMLAVFFSSFQFASTAGIYYRSSKILLGTVLLGWLFHWRRSILDPRTGDAWKHGVLCVAAGLLDRQGFFFGVAAAVILGGYSWNTRRMRPTLRAIVVALGALVIYNLALAPAAIHALNGYWPDFEYQSRSLRSVVLLWHPGYFFRAVALLAQNTAVLFGGVVPALALFGLGAALSRAMLNATRTSRLCRYIVAVLAAEVVMFAMMIHQHPPIDQFVDHRLWYYPVPFVITVIFGWLLWIDAMALSGRRLRAVQLALVAIIIINISTLAGRRDVMAHGPYFERVFTQSELLKRSLATGNPEPALDEGYRGFFDEEQRFRAH